MNEQERVDYVRTEVEKIFAASEENGVPIVWSTPDERYKIEWAIHLTFAIAQMDITAAEIRFDLDCLEKEMIGA